VTRFAFCEPQCDW